MSDTDLASLIHAVIALLGAITMLITIINHDRISRLHDKVAQNSTDINLIKSATEDTPANSQH